MDEFVDAAVTLKQDNPTPANFSGFWLPGQDWRNGVTFVWDAGGDLAVEDGGEWQGALSSPESVAGLETVQRLFLEASGAAKDGNEADPQVAFCSGEVAMLSAPGWLRGVLEDPASGCPDLMENVGVFAMPGSVGRAGTGAARWVEHRRLGEVAAPGARQEPRRPHAERGVPDDHG